MDSVDHVDVAGERYQIDQPVKYAQGKLVSISVVGNELTDRPGILAQLAGALSAFGINIHTVAHCTLQQKILFLIDASQRKRALDIIHKIFVEHDKATIIEYMRRHMTQTLEMVQDGDDSVVTMSEVLGALLESEGLAEILPAASEGTVALTGVRYLYLRK